LNVGDLVKTRGFHEGWDEEWQSWTIDEDRLLDYMEEVVNPEDGPAATGPYLSLPLVDVWELIIRIRH
jgi:adenylate kinase